MVRVKIIKPHKKYKVGETVYVERNDAHTLIDGGFGILTKDMVATDYRTEKASGYVTKLRTNNSRRR